MYYLTFITHFDLSVITNSSLPHKDNSVFQLQIEETVDKLKSILTLHPGINEISMPIIFNNITYHITLQH